MALQKTGHSFPLLSAKVPQQRNKPLFTKPSNFALSSGHHRSLRKADCMILEISQGETQQKRPGLSEPKASFQGAAERALEISQIHAQAGSNAGDVCKKRQRFVSHCFLQKCRSRGISCFLCGQ